MKHFHPGYFFGHNNQLGTFADVTVTETEFEYKFIDWHGHENPYFSLTLVGYCMESNRKKTYYCSTDSLLFHNEDQKHYNVKSGERSFGFQVEIDPRWYSKFEISAADLPANAQIEHPG